MRVIQEFLDSLKTGEFRVPICKSCRKKAWPPAKLCPVCLSSTSLEKIERIGVVIEFAKSQVKNREGSFGVIDIDGIRLVGALKADKISSGMKMRMVACGVSEDCSPFYDFEPLEGGR